MCLTELSDDCKCTTFEFVENIKLFRRKNFQLIKKCVSETVKF